MMGNKQPLALIVCVVGRGQKLRAVRDELRAKFGHLAQFHTVRATTSPRWLEWQAELSALIAPAADGAA